MRIGKLILGKNPDIKRPDYTDRKEFYFDKNTDVIPKAKNRLTCIMFSEDKGCHILFRKFNINQEYSFFRFKKGIYVIDNESIHIASNGARVSFYLEGISTPIKMSNIEHETKEVEYVDLYGKKHKTIIEKIKGLKFDAKILDTFTNRRFAELFTKQDINNFQVFILIIGIVTMVIAIASCIVGYVYH